jgi:hypothetical protein
LFEQAGDSVADFLRRQRRARCRAMLGNDVAPPALDTSPRKAQG